MAAPAVSRQSFIFWMGIALLVGALPTYEGVQALRRYQSNCELLRMIGEADVNVCAKPTSMWYASRIPESWKSERGWHPKRGWELGGVTRALFEKTEHVGLPDDDPEGGNRAVKLIPVLQACPDLREVQFLCRQPAPEVIAYFREALPKVKIVDYVPPR